MFCVYTYISLLLLLLYNPAKRNAYMYYLRITVLVRTNINKTVHPDMQQNIRRCTPPGHQRLAPYETKGGLEGCNTEPHPGLSPSQSGSLSRV